MSDVTRREVIKLAAAGAALAVGATAMQAADEPEVIESYGQDWDCIRNKTGKNLRITLASGNYGDSYILPQDYQLRFKVRKTTKKMAYVAYELGTDKLVRMAEFSVLHQPFPPKNCLNIYATKKAERHAETTVAGSSDHAPATSGVY